MNPEHCEIAGEILKERARIYARDEKKKHRRLVEYLLVFRLGDQWLGIATKVIREVTRFENGVVIPRAKPALLGMVNLRGTFIPFIDFHKLLHIPQQTSFRDNANLIVVESSGGLFCFATEEFYNIVEIYEEYILSEGLHLHAVAGELVESVVAIMIAEKQRKVAWLKAGAWEKLLSDQL